MRHKILTVDDSKTVRLIVRKAFKNFDCDIIDAANGVEGLSMAGKESPDVILLDVTMPVMDGVEMLTRLKSDPQLKQIPVVMLTAEGGRDNVIKIAKIGIRDYIVKPFKEETLLEKLGRIIDLRPIADSKITKSILDPCNILVIEDQQAIVAQIQDGLSRTPWKIHGVAMMGEALDLCRTHKPDLVMISLSLPDDGAFKLFRLLRTNMETKSTPIFALAVRTDAVAQQQAQQIGFTSIVTKPIEIDDLEQKMAKAMNLDTSPRYFSLEKDTLVMRMPANCSQSALNEITTHLGPKLAEAVNAGLHKVIVDAQETRALTMPVIKLLFQAMQSCRDLSMRFSLVGNDQLISECKGLEQLGRSLSKVDHLGLSALRFDLLLMP